MGNSQSRISLLCYLNCTKDAADGVVQDYLPETTDTKANAKYPNQFIDIDMPTAFSEGIVMEKYYALILELLDLKVDEGVHWYKLDRLMMLTDEPLAYHESVSQVVRELSDLGLLKVIKNNSPLSGNCVISDEGKKWLTDRSYSGSLARELLSTLVEEYNYFT